jgi:IS605 OrfB family transposase
MERAILLQGNPTTAKRIKLSEFERKATDLANFIIGKKITLHDFHNSTLYRECKDSFGFNTQVVTAISRVAVKTKGISMRHITVKFNVPRNCKTFETSSMFFVELGIYPRNRIAVPIKKNRNLERYFDLLKNGWACKTYGLTSHLDIVAYLSKEDIELPSKKNVLGIDFNAKRIAVSVLSDKGKVLHQNYFGMNIWIKRKKIMRRRSIMQSFNNVSALQRLKTRERNFVDTNLGQMIKGITDLALRFDADISIENLKRFRPKGKRFNKIVMRMPFLKFKEILTSRCFDKGITLDIVDSWHTSKFCNHCGAVGKGHDSSNYALFRCKECGVVMNSDRNASRNIALKCLLERKDSINHKPFQISNRSGLVNDHLLPNAVVEPIVAVRHISSTYGKPTPFMGE